MNAIYTGKVGHVRLLPFRHAFSYRIFSMLIDLDAVPQLAVFSHNRFNLMSFHNCDHGAGTSENPKHWVLEQLVAEKILALPNWHISLLCFPRMLGFVFNPLAIYFCFDEAGVPRAIVHQVSNTFGERHSYVLPVTTPIETKIKQSCKKNFHVSPFMPVDGGYRFQLAQPDENLNIKIEYLAPDGATRMIATQTGVRADFTTVNALKAFIFHPLMTLRVVASIHWQALKLWRKGATFYRKPAPPATLVSSNIFSPSYKAKEILE
jgi:uncharacterized protein